MNLASTIKNYLILKNWNEITGNLSKCQEIQLRGILPFFEIKKEFNWISVGTKFASKKNFELQNSSSKFLPENFFTLTFVQYNFEMAAMVEVIVVVLAVVWLGGSPGCRTNRELGFDASYCARDKNLPFATFRNNIFSFSNTVLGQK